MDVRAPVVTPSRRRPPVDRFMPKFTPSANGCWQWTGAINPSGYGMFNAGHRTAGGHPKPEPAHRFSYEAFVGPIPAGLYLDHLCENRACVNPSHLEPVTNAENIARGYRRRQPTHCRNGHPWTVANTRPSGPAGRSCRRCHADYQRDRKRAITFRGDAA